MTAHHSSLCRKFKALMGLGGSGLARLARGTGWGRSSVGLALVLGTLGAPAAADTRYTFNVVGRPRVPDVLPPSPPSVAYVEINVTTFSNSAETISETTSEMQGGAVQVIRLTTEQAAALAEKLRLWLLAPEEETVFLNKVIYVPNPPPPGPPQQRPAAQPARER